MSMKTDENPTIHVYVYYTYNSFLYDLLLVAPAYGAKDFSVLLRLGGPQGSGKKFYQSGDPSDPDKDSTATLRLCNRKKTKVWTHEIGR